MSFFIGVYLHMQIKFEGVKKQLESQEMEVMEARIMKTSELNGELNDEDDDAGQCSGELRGVTERHLQCTQVCFSLNHNVLSENRSWDLESICSFKFQCSMN